MSPSVDGVGVEEGLELAEDVTEELLVLSAMIARLPASPNA